MSIKDTLKYRNVWMGVAMIWIMFFHADFSCSNNFIKEIITIGYGGVDIFLFASGIGNYFSYFKSENPLTFITKRILRLAPIYVPFIIVWCIFKIIVDSMNPIYVIGNVFMIQSFSSKGFSFNWYLTIMVVCYILTPYFAEYIKQNSFTKCTVLVLLLLISTTAFFGDYTFIISAARLPIYVVGMICAKYSDVKIDKEKIIYIFSIFLLGSGALFFFKRFLSRYLWSCGLYWYPFILMVPFMCFMISYALSKIRNHSLLIISCILERIGKISFEIYLIHCFLFVDCVSFIHNHNFNLNNYMWLILFVLAFVGAEILHMISTKIRILTKI